MRRVRSLVPGAIVASALVLLSALTSCSGQPASEILATAELEEKQNALDHALELYREIVEKYPGTPEARQAQARLDAIAAATAPASNP